MADAIAEQTYAKGQPDNKPDPTANVQAIVESAVKRIDDLREASCQRTDDLMEAERRRVDEQMQLRADYTEKLTQAEAKRIDAIRAVDVNAVSIANERAGAQATVLANQVAASADTLRALVAATAATVAQQLTQVTTQFTERLALLEKAQYEGQGKQAVADPMMAALVVEMKSMRESVSNRDGSGHGMRDMFSWIVAGIGVAIGVAGYMSQK